MSRFKCDKRRAPYEEGALLGRRDLCSEQLKMGELSHDSDVQPRLPRAGGDRSSGGSRRTLGGANANSKQGRSKIRALGLGEGRAEGGASSRWHRLGQPAPR